MDVNKLIANLFHHLKGDGSIVDEGAAFLLWAEFASKDTLVGVVVKVILLEEVFHAVVIEGEGGFHDAFLVFVEQDSAVATVTQYKSQGAQKDGLTGSCFTGNHAESPAEINREILDKRIVLDVKVL